MDRKCRRLRERDYMSAEGAMELCHSDFFGRNMLWGVQLTESLKLPLQRRWKALLTRVAARR